jgi:flagellar biogenesis protein FliO
MEAARQVFSVLLVFVLLGLALWALRRRGQTVSAGRLWPRSAPARPGSLQSLDRLILSPQHSLHLVSVEGRQLVVAIYPEGCTVLTELAKGAGA